MCVRVVRNLGFIVAPPSDLSVLIRPSDTTKGSGRQTCLLDQMSLKAPSHSKGGNSNIYVVQLTYLLTPWSSVLLEKLSGFAANQEIPRILWNPKVHYRTHKLPSYNVVPAGRVEQYAYYHIPKSANTACTKRS